MSEHKTFKDKFDDICNFKSISIQGLMLISFTVVSTVIVFVLGIIFTNSFQFKVHKRLFNQQSRLLHKLQQI